MQQLAALAALRDAAETFLDGPSASTFDEQDRRWFMVAMGGGRLEACAEAMRNVAAEFDRIAHEIEAPPDD